MACKHKTDADHTIEGPAPGQRRWRCSECPTFGPWSEGWLYYGCLECPLCWRTRVDKVFCPSCAKGKPVLEEKPRRQRSAKSLDQARARLEAKRARAQAEADKLQAEIDALEP